MRLFDHLHCASDQRLEVGMAWERGIILYVAHSDSELHGNHYHGEIQLSNNYNFIVFMHACRN